jgi:hypothetical protein
MYHRQAGWDVRRAWPRRVALWLVGRMLSARSDVNHVVRLLRQLTENATHNVNAAEITERRVFLYVWNSLICTAQPIWEHVQDFASLGDCHHPVKNVAKGSQVVL